MTARQQDAIAFIAVGAAIGVAMTKSKTFRNFALGVLATAAAQAQKPKLPAAQQVIEIDVSDL